MGVSIPVRMLNAEVLRKATNPIVLCTFPNRVARLMETEQYVLVNMNVLVAEALLRFPKQQRHARANDETMSIVSQCHSPVFLKDYDILFDPRYNIDALKVFGELSRRQKVVVKWCGTLNGNSLNYASPEYKDYHSFRIQDYDITCVI